MIWDAAGSAHQRGPKAKKENIFSIWASFFAVISEKYFSSMASAADQNPNGTKISGALNGDPA